MMTCALIWMARSAAAVSVLKYGFPVPAAKMTISQLVKQAGPGVSIRRFARFQIGQE